MKKLYLILSFLVLILHFSCDNDNSTITDSQGNNTEIPDNFSDYFGNETAHSFVGRIIDSNDNPIEGVAISIGTSTANTDENGVFIINDASVHEQFAYVKAEKNGYITGSRALTPTDGMNNITIMLLEETIAGTVTSGTEQTVSLSNGASVKLPGNYIKEDGSVYEGSVNVVMHHLDPESEDLSLQMPGMLYGQNEDGAERFLQSFGMLAVELIGSGNEKLNLAEGSTAEIRMPLSPAMAAQANSTIPLWHFDDDKGYWIEEGEATLQGNEYVGSVSHFSFWNCDVPTEVVNLCVTVLDENNNPLPGLLLTITSDNFGSAYGVTNSIGTDCGIIPANENLSLEVYSTGCGAVIHSENIGSYSTDTSIDVIVSYEGFTEYSISGELQACDDVPVFDGYVKIVGDVFTILPVNNGDFSYHFFSCADEYNVTVYGYDIENSQPATPLDVILNLSQPNVDTGVLMTCNTIDEYITFQEDSNAPVNFVDVDILAQLFEDPIGPQLYISANDGPYCFRLTGRLNPNSLLGTYEFNIWWDTDDLGMNLGECFTYNPDVPVDIEFTLTNIGEVGELIEISFSGTYSEVDPDIINTISGTVHVIRDE